MEEVTLYKIETNKGNAEFFIVADEEGRMLYRKEKDFVLDYKNPNETITVLPAGEDGIQQAVLRVYWCMWPDNYGGEVVSDEPLELEVNVTVKESKTIPYSEYEKAVTIRKVLNELKNQKKTKLKEEGDKEFVKIEAEYDEVLAQTSNPDYLDEVEAEHEERKKAIAKEYVSFLLENRIPSLEELLWN